MTQAQLVKTLRAVVRQYVEAYEETPNVLFVPAAWAPQLQELPGGRDRPAKYDGHYLISYGGDTCLAATIADYLLPGRAGAPPM